MADEFTGHDGVSVAVALPQRDPHGHIDQLDGLGGRGVPGHDLVGEDIQDERDIDESLPGPDVGEVHDPGLVWGRRGEVAVQQVSSAAAVLARDRRSHRLAASDPLQSRALMARSTDPGEAVGIERRTSAVIFRRPYRPSGVSRRRPV